MRYQTHSTRIDNKGCQTEKANVVIMATRKKNKSSRDRGKYITYSEAPNENQASCVMIIFVGEDQE
jgi:hypothetical protein